MNKIRQTILDKKERVLNVYFTAGHPTIDGIETTIEALEEAGADLVELGMPYSDPLADGLTIQKSSEVALANGMNLRILFDKVKTVTDHTSIPIILMGYYNQLLQFGMDRFLDEVTNAGVSGLIIPDMPMFEYEEKYIEKFKDRNLGISFLISPMTSDERIRQADKLSSGFLYVVSQSSITGKTNAISDGQKSYFEKVNNLGLAAPRLIGFGIHDKATFDMASENSNGAIVGSAFIRALEKDHSPQAIKSFIKAIID
jgi:tryptophan synthase alpha chain